MIAIAAVSFCIAANALSFRHLVNPPRMPSNFWLVLYGIAKGGTWLDSVRDEGRELFDFTKVSTVSEEELWYGFVSQIGRASCRERVSIGAWAAGLPHG